MVMTPPPTHDSAVSHHFHRCPAFLRRHFPPQSPPSPPLDRSLRSQQQPSAWDCSTIPKLQFPASAPSRRPASWSRVGTLWQGLSDSHSIRRPQSSCFTLSLKHFSSDSDNCPSVGTGLLLQSPHPPRAVPVLLTLLFSPLVSSSYRVLHGSLYSLPLARYPCLLSAGVLRALLHLKMYS